MKTYQLQSEEKELIITLATLGASANKIAEIMNRKPNTITHFLYKQARGFGKYYYYKPKNKL